MQMSFDYLSHVQYPASKDDVIRTSKEQNAPQDIVDKMQNLPDKTYSESSEVISALGFPGFDLGEAGKGKAA